MNQVVKDANAICDRLEIVANAILKIREVSHDPSISIASRLTLQSTMIDMAASLLSITDILKRQVRDDTDLRLDGTPSTPEIGKRVEWDDATAAEKYYGK